MSIALYRIDDRLVHGQVVVGWGQPLHAEFIVLVDDQVAHADWEQELYRMSVPPGMDVLFADVEAAARAHAAWAAERRVGIVLTADVRTMDRLARAVGSITRVNVGGIHHRPGRVQKLRYVYLTPAEAIELHELAARGIEITAQDVPTARAITVDELLEKEAER